MTRPDRGTVRAILDLFEVEGCDFYHNEPNDYGVITLRLFLGEGDPYKLYAGDETQARYGSGTGVIRGTGRFKLNDRLLDWLVKQIDSQCPCGDRIRGDCPGEWEPGCDLGSNPRFARGGNQLESR